MNPDIFGSLNIILDEILQFKYVQLFDELPIAQDYLQIIKNPICINQIISKTRNNEYNNFDEFSNDFKLLKDNTQLYFGEISRNYVTSLIIYQMVCDLIEKVTNPENDENLKEKGNLNLLNGICKNISFITKENLVQISEFLQKKYLTIKNVLEYFNCSYSTFKDQFKVHKIEYPQLSANKMKNEISERNIQNIKNIFKTWEVGYQTMCRYLQISEWETRKIYQDIFTKNDEEIKKEKKHTKKFFATKINCIWHTDIHYLKKEKMTDSDEKYLLCFIDDCSRKILFSATSNNKDQLFVINSLLKCIHHCRSKPFILTTDNGGEFCGDLMKFTLKLLEINHWRTKPYTPQQNGKIERWWRGLENLKNYKDIDNFIRSYNEIIPKYHLQELANKYLGMKISLNQATPEYIYQNTPKFESYHEGVYVEIETKEDE